MIVIADMKEVINEILVASKQCTLNDHMPKAIKLQATGHRAQGTGHRAQGTGHRAQGTGHIPIIPQT